SPGVPAARTTSEVPPLTADEVLDGDVMAGVRRKTIAQANSDTCRFTTIPDVTLVGSLHRQPAHTCSEASTASISAKLQDYDWVGSVTIDYQFHKDLK
ncbi:MAG TPA: hypothetical protein VFW55_02480, partial [Propionicimonas sp.]|nr:hypothetical protein [Propionicimonas sp.]